MFLDIAASVVVYAEWSFSVLYVPFWGEASLVFGGVVTTIWIVGVTFTIADSCLKQSFRDCMNVTNVHSSHADR